MRADSADRLGGIILPACDFNFRDHCAVVCVDDPPGGLVAEGQVHRLAVGSDAILSAYLPYFFFHSTASVFKSRQMNWSSLYELT